MERGQPGPALWLKRLASAWLCFHLFAVLIVPASVHYVASRTRGLVEPYVNLLGINTTWNFFAPEPGPPPVFVEFEAIDSAGNQITRGYWPNPESPYFWRERQNRRVALARYMLGETARAERLMGVFLCRRNPGAHAIRMWRTMYDVASLPSVAEGRATIKSDTIQKRDWIAEQSCMEAAP